MAIELPSRPSADDDDTRLAFLEDPVLAARLFRENPALFAHEPPRTQREVLAWTTRRVGTIALAVTAAVSIAAGYLVTGFALHNDRHAAPLAVPAHHRAAAPAHHAHHAAPAPHVAARPHVAAPVGASAALVAPTAPRIVHVAPVAPSVSHEAQIVRAQRAEIARLRAEATEAAAQAARAHALQAQSGGPGGPTSNRPLNARGEGEQGDSARAVSVPVSGPAGNTTEPSSTHTSPLDAPQPTVGKPATGPSGGWTEHSVSFPGAGGPIWGPADPCTPHGGRTGIVMQMVQAAAAAGLGHLR